MRSTLFVFMTSLFLGACSTASHTSDDHDLPLMDIQKAVSTQIPGGLDTVSPNQREFSSRFFGYQRPGAGYSASGVPTERHRARVSIIGDRRPYRLKVEVSSEKLHGKQWKVEKADPELAERINQRILDHLSKTSQKNLIDHFRPF